MPAPRRQRPPSRRSVVLVAAVGALVAITFVVAPGAGGPDAALELVIAGADGTASREVRLDAAAFRERPDTIETPDSTAPPGPPRVPLMLAVRSTGGRATRVSGLRLGVPASYRLHDIGAGRAERADSAPARTLSVESEGDAALVLRDVAIRPVEVRAGAAPIRVTAADTLWLEPVRLRVECALDPDSVPRFRPAWPPASNPRDLRLFYRLTSEGDAEYTGVLRLVVAPDPSRGVDHVEAVMGPVSTRVSGFGLPDSARLVPRAEYLSTCADGRREHAVLVRFLLSDDGGRAYLVSVGQAVRTRLEDLDGNDVIEREVWDADGDGRFEASRVLSLPLPSALDSERRRAILRTQVQAQAARRAEEAARRARRRPPPDSLTPPAEGRVP
ncbi:MAG: hypothetical protein ABFS34_02080 [Gemmatimonadota bacterium]